MHAREQRVRAVELYIKYGPEATATTGELGYPSRVQLRSWHREYVREGGTLPERSMGRYTQGQKRAAVEHHPGHGRCNAHARRELGYPKSTQKLAEWTGGLAPGARRTSEPRAFDAREKASAVEALASRDGSAQEVADQVGSSRRAPCKWKRELLPEEGCPMPDPKTAVPGGPPAGGGPGPTHAAQAETDSLEARGAEPGREVRDLEPERDVPEGALGLLGKGAGADPANEPANREKAQLVESLRGRWGLCELLRAVGLARSSHQYQLAAMARPDGDAGTRELVCGVFDASDGTYGRRRIHDELAAQGHAVGERRIARIMAEEGLVARGRAKRRPRHGSYAGEVSEHPGNRVGHDFSAGLPNFLWPADVTMFSIPAGRPCPGPVLDCFDGSIVSWTVSRAPTAEMANSMLRAALAATTEEERRWLVIHSDCGCHYRWPEWISACEGAGISRSMSRKGRSPDNSRMEGFFGTMKTEMFLGRDWAGVTLDELEARIDDYIEWHNAGRIKRSLGGMSPLRFRESLGLAA